MLQPNWLVVLIHPLKVIDRYLFLDLVLLWGRFFSLFETFRQNSVSSCYCWSLYNVVNVWISFSWSRSKRGNVSKRDSYDKSVVLHDHPFQVRLSDTWIPQSSTSCPHEDTDLLWCLVRQRLTLKYILVEL